MKTLPMFEAAPAVPTPTHDKPTIITVTAGAGRHIAAVTLFEHLRRALEGQSLCGVTTLTIIGDGSVILDRNGVKETVYQPRRKVGA